LLYLGFRQLVAWLGLLARNSPSLASDVAIDSVGLIHEYPGRMTWITS
jgi:hypothetical protein